MTAKEKAEQILKRLDSRKFSQWYSDGGKMDDYLIGYPEGNPSHVTKEQILQEIVQMFSLADDVELMEMMLCEQDHIYLRADQPYIFRVDPNCAKCRELHEISKLPEPNK